MYIVPMAYAKEATTTAIVPANPHQPPSGRTPARMATPAMPSRIPNRRRPVDFSAGRKWMARAATKIGTVALAIAATPESTFVSPQAMSVNGTAVLTAPSTIAGFMIFRISLQALCQPWRAMRSPTSGIADKASRKPIVVVGSSSSTATLMNMKEEPQSAANTSRSGT